MKAVFFDYFGVICGSAYWDSVYRLEEASGNLERMDDLAEDVNSGHISWPDFCRRVAANIGEDPRVVEEKYREQRIDAAVITYIQNLRSRGMRVYLASNAHHGFLEPILADIGLDTAFDGFFISSRLGVTKPHPGFYEKILDETGLRGGDCVFVDDIGYNVEAAEAAGMRGVLFTGAEASLKELEAILTNY